MQRSSKASDVHADKPQLPPESTWHKTHNPVNGETRRVCVCVCVCGVGGIFHIVWVWKETISSGRYRAIKEEAEPTTAQSLSAVLGTVN